MRRLWLTTLCVLVSAACSSTSGDNGATDGSSSSGSGGPSTLSGSQDTTTTTTTTGGTSSTSQAETNESSGPTRGTDGTTTEQSTGTSGTDTDRGTDSGSGSSSTGPTCEERCDDGVFCNGVEECDPSKEASGCIPGNSPCDVDIVCDEDADECITERRVFVTAATFSGELGGTVGADGLCQQAAEATALGGTWLAYIVDPVNPLDRHTPHDVPYVRIDGVQVADSWMDLTDESIQNPINVDETGATVTGNAWTGMINVAGPVTGEIYCQGWTSSTGNCFGEQICGGAGEIAAVDDHWDGYFIFNCFDQHRLYCIEQ